MSTVAPSTGVTDAIVSYAVGGWAMRTPLRDAGRGLLAVTLTRARERARAPEVEAVLAAVDRGEPRLSAGAIGRPERLPAIAAALVNGVAAGGQPSPAVPVVCAALAAGEALAAPGAVVLDALIAGTEIAVRLAAALGPAHAARGWEADGTCGRIGAAVAATRIFGLTGERTRNALGIAATGAGGLRAAVGTMTAAYVRGLAAADGVEAALLARFGFTGAPQAIEGRRGLAALMTTGFDPALLLDGLGERYTFLELADVSAGARALASLPPELQERVAGVARLASIAELRT